MGLLIDCELCSGGEVLVLSVLRNRDCVGVLHTLCIRGITFGGSDDQQAISAQIGSVSAVWVSVAVGIAVGGRSGRQSG